MDLTATSGLFVVSFLSATLLPGGSEAVLVGTILAGSADPATLVAVATAGNTMGAVVNWFCGRFLLRFRERRWFPVSLSGLERVTAIYRRYGVWTLLFAWVPVVGDAFTVFAGTSRVPLVLFTALVLIGKGGRYVAVAAATMGLPG